MESPTAELEESLGCVDKSLELEGDGLTGAAERVSPPPETAASPQPLGDLVSCRVTKYVCILLKLL